MPIKGMMNHSHSGGNEGDFFILYFQCILYICWNEDIALIREPALDKTRETKKAQSVVKVMMEIYGSSSSDHFSFLSEAKRKHLQLRMKMREVLGFGGKKRYEIII